jgi:hypothetical protein
MLIEELGQGFNLIANMHEVKVSRPFVTLNIQKISEFTFIKMLS